MLLSKTKRVEEELQVEPDDRRPAAGRGRRGLSAAALRATRIDVLAVGRSTVAIDASPYQAEIVSYGR